MKDAGGIGAARTRCFYSHFSFNDPIVYPGMADRAHLHMFWGADHVDENGIAPTSGGTCRGGAVNLSGYWAPALLTPDGRALTPTYVDVYYKSSAYDINGTPRVSPPPKGLKVIAGDMSARPETPQNRNRFYWTCGETDGGAKQPGVPINCSDPIIGMHVFFPPCNDGRLDSPTHKDHMSYPVNGSCPSTHPFLLPTLSYHVYFRNVPANSRLSCDAPTGQGGFCLHADWIANWKDDVIKSMVDSCINKGLSCGSDLVGDNRSLGIFGGN